MNSTVVTFLFVIITVVSSKSHGIMISQPVSCCTRIKPNEQCVVRCFISDREIAILGVSIPGGRGVDLHSQLARNLRQLMDLFVSKPKLSSNVTKAIFVLVPPPEESDKAIKAFVKDSPSTAISLHVTVHIKTGSVGWVYCVHAAFFEAGWKQLGTVPCCKRDIHWEGIKQGRKWLLKRLFLFQRRIYLLLASRPTQKDAKRIKRGRNTIKTHVLKPGHYFDIQTLTAAWLKPDVSSYKPRKKGCKSSECGLTI